MSVSTVCFRQASMTDVELMWAKVWINLFILKRNKMKLEDLQGNGKFENTSLAKHYLLVSICRRLRSLAKCVDPALQFC